MDIRNYTRTAIALHWAMAPLILAGLVLGLYMTGLPLSPLKLKLYAWHKWLGMTLWLLVLVRLAWRAGHPAPPLPAGMPSWQRRLAAAMHGGLYLLMLAIPVSGWLMSSAKGFQTVYLGVLPLPDLLGRDPGLGRLLETVHAWLNYSLIGLLVPHVAAAIKHHRVDGDDVLRRMAPWIK